MNNTTIDLIWWIMVAKQIERSENLFALKKEAKQ